MENKEPKYDLPICIIDHNAGFFSCCSIIFIRIVEYINKYKNLPPKIDTSKTFIIYKPLNEKTRDIRCDYFENENNIDFDELKPQIPLIISHDNKETQFSDYRLLNFNVINPIINKYFTPNQEIKNTINIIENKYNIDYENTCVLFHRGNDKCSETKIPSYHEYIPYINKVLLKNPNIRFLIQSDETEFFDFISSRYSNHVIFYDEIRHMKKQRNSVDKIKSELNNKYSKLFLAITIIMSKCKYNIFNGGNCSNWVVYYKGNATNICEYLNGVWYDNIM